MKLSWIAEIPKKTQTRGPHSRTLQLLLPMEVFISCPQNHSAVVAFHA